MQFLRRILRPSGLVYVTTFFIIASMASCRDAAQDPSASGGASGSRAGGAGGGKGGSTGGGGSPANGGSKGIAGNSGRGGTSSSGAGGTGASGGSKGSGGVTSTGGTSAAPDAGPGIAPDAAPSRGPMPATPGHAFPFPQNRPSSRCIYPAGYRNEDVKAAFTQWKNDTVTSDGASGFRRVKRPKEPGLEVNSTVSEGIAYGMIIAVYMDDQDLFDDLWQYEQKWLDQKTGLMNWYINASGTGVGENPNGGGPASDADEDMGFALVMADKQWGGQGKLSKKYIDYAKSQISNIWNNMVFDSKYLKSWASSNLPPLNPSYFAPAFYKVFATVDTANATNWKNLTDTMYNLLSTTLNSSNKNANNGLVPAWCNQDGSPNSSAFGPGSPSPTNYQYDSCRTPFRIGLDYCWTGDTRAQAYVAKTSGFFSGIGATKMVDGYALDGTPQPQCQTGANAQIQSSAFVGPAGVGAMSSATYQTFVNDAYAVLATGKAIVGGTYYDDSWMVMSLLMMTGNYIDYTSL